MDYCKTCVYYPPSSLSGKPCTQCDPTSAFHTCYREKEFIVDYFQQEHKQTNADRIRSMSDEEMAEWFVHLTDCVNCPCRDPHDKCDTVDGSCQKQWLDWLKEESEGE